MKLHHHALEEEPLMMAVVQHMNDILFKASEEGLSLSGGLNCLMHAMTMTLVSAYADDATRRRVVADIPDVIKAYTPQWEQIVFDGTGGVRGKNHREAN